MGKKWGLFFSVKLKSYWQNEKDKKALRHFSEVHIKTVKFMGAKLYSFGYRNCTV